MPGILKLDRLLSDADRAALDELLARPGTRIEDAHAWVKERGYEAGISAVYAYVRRQRPGRPKMHRLSKLDKEIKPKDRARVDALCADPRTRVEDLHRLVTSLGYDISRIACWRHLRGWRHELADIRRSARFARSLATVAQDVGPAAFSRGAMLGFEQVVMEQVFYLKSKGEVPPADLTDWAAALERTIGVRGQLETLRRKSEAAARNDPAGSRADSAGAAPEKPRVVNGVEIANCVRRILGVPLPGEPVAEAELVREAPQPEAPPEPDTPTLPLPSAGEGGGEGGA